MATVTGMTAEAIAAEVEDAVITASIDPSSGVLTLQTKGGNTFTVGSVGTVKDSLNAAYPVGSIFMSAVGTNPSALLGIGTWVAWGTGRVPVGVDTSQSEFSLVEKTGGEKTHVLSAAEMPSHQHVIPPHQHTIQVSNFQGTQYADTVPYDNGAHSFVQGTTGNKFFKDPSAGGTTSQDPGGNTSAVGGGGAHNNLQPYITCYMWKRTA